MIDATTDAGITLITICKYDKYQRVSLPTDATVGSVPDVSPTHDRRKVEGNEYKEDAMRLILMQKGQAFELLTGQRRLNCRKFQLARKHSS